MSRKNTILHSALVRYTRKYRPLLTDIEKLLYKIEYGEEPGEVSSSPLLTEEIVLEFPTFPWEWERFRFTRYVSPEFILRHGEKLDFYRLSFNTRVPAEFIERTITDPGWFWPLVREMKVVSPELISRTRDAPWFDDDDAVDSVLFANPNFTLPFIKENWENRDEWPFTGYGLSRNPNVTFAFVREHPDFEWDWAELSENEHTTLRDIEENLDLPWRWDRVAANPNCTFDFVQKYRDHDWYDRIHGYDLVADCVGISHEQIVTIFGDE